MSALLIRLIVRLMSYLSVSGARRAANWIGEWSSHLDLDATRVTRANITACFPNLDPIQREMLLKESLQHTALIALEAGILWHWPIDRCQSLWRSVSGDDLIEDGLAFGNGVLLLVPHFGNWEALSIYLGRWGYTCLYDPPRLKGLERPVREARSRTGGQLLPIGNAGIRGVLKTLRAGGMVVLLPDQVPDAAGGVYAPFFGRQALTMSLCRKLLRQTGAAPILGAAIRVEGGFRIEFRACAQGVAGDDPVLAATALNAEIESLIQQAPAQYQWEYRRFKRPPPGAEPLYERKSRRSK